jgi:hypothetical protein
LEGERVIAFVVEVEHLKTLDELDVKDITQYGRLAYCSSVADKWMQGSGYFGLRSAAAGILAIGTTERQGVRNMRRIQMIS